MQEIDSTFWLGPYRPHITLTIVNEIVLSDLIQQLQEALNSFPKFSVYISSMGFFDVPLISFFNVAFSQQLYLLHSLIHTVITSQQAKPEKYYMPDRWTPHISITSSLPQEKCLMLIEMFQTLQFPVTAYINRIGIIEEPQKRELETIIFLDNI